MSLSLYGTYLVFVILLVIAPGPDTVVVLKNSLAGGRPAGMISCLGVTTGNLVQGTAVAFGVGALIVRSQPVFDSLRVAGVVYLCWLGLQALRSARRGGTGGPLGELDPPAEAQPPAGVPAAGGTAPPGRRHRAPRAFRSWRQGFLSNVTNPKVLAMYLSVLPQFLDRGHSSTAAALALAYTVGILGLAWQVGLVAAVHRARAWIQRRKVRRALDAITGTALIGFGIALAAESQ
jgi:threonine/homoserine/homoserine lactone efflux protein